MTLEQVMAMGNWGLNRLVALKIGAIPDPPEMYWSEEDGRQLPVRGVPIPDFAGDWNAAAQVREWARGLTRAQQRAFLTAVECCAEKRLGPFRKGWIVMDMETIDLARAALLVTP